MRVIISVILVFLSCNVFSQKITDKINFTSFNREFFSEELIKMIIEYRQIIGSSEMLKDTVPMFSAKYKMLYFEKYGDESVLHDKPIEYDIYGRGYKISSILDSPENRLFSSGLYINHSELNLLICEESKYYDVSSLSNLTYYEFLKLVFNEFKENKNLLYDSSVLKKYIGVANSLYIDDSEIKKFGITLVVGIKK